MLRSKIVYISTPRLSINSEFNFNQVTGSKKLHWQWPYHIKLPCIPKQWSSKVGGILTANLFTRDNSKIQYDGCFIDGSSGIPACKLQLTYQGMIFM